MIELHDRMMTGVWNRGVLYSEVNECGDNYSENVAIRLHAVDNSGGDYEEILVRCLLTFRKFGLLRI